MVRACIEGPYDCILGDREKARGTFREFVFYDSENVLGVIDTIEHNNPPPLWMKPPPLKKLCFQLGSWEALDEI